MINVPNGTGGCHHVSPCSTRIKDLCGPLGLFPFRFAYVDENLGYFYKSFCRWLHHLPFSLERRTTGKLESLHNSEINVFGVQHQRQYMRTHEEVISQALGPNRGDWH